MFNDILTFLTSILPNFRKSRIKTLSWLIESFLNNSDWPTKRTLNSFCRLITRKVSFEAKKKQVMRFLKNKAFNMHNISSSLLTCILNKISNTLGYIPVIIDWVTKDNWALLGAALSSKLGRALVFNEILCLQKDLTLNQNSIEINFIKSLKDILDRFESLGYQFVLIADRGFAKVNVIEPIIERVAFIIRVRSKVMFYLNEVGKGILLEDIARRLLPGEIWEGEGFYHQTRKIKIRVVIIGSRDEPWILITNIRGLPAKAILSLYAQRTLIEQSFRDFQRGVLNFLRLISTFRDITKGEHWVILGILSHWILMKIGIALEATGRIEEFSPRAWRGLIEKGYKRVISLIRAAISSIKAKRYPKVWTKIDDWNLHIIELSHSGYT